MLKTTIAIYDKMRRYFESFLDIEQIRLFDAFPTHWEVKTPDWQSNVS